MSKLMKIELKIHKWIKWGVLLLFSVAFPTSRTKGTELLEEVTSLIQTVIEENKSTPYSKRSIYAKGESADRLTEKIRELHEEKKYAALLELFRSHTQNDHTGRLIATTISRLPFDYEDIDIASKLLISAADWPIEKFQDFEWGDTIPIRVNLSLTKRIYGRLTGESLTRDEKAFTLARTNPKEWLRSLLGRFQGKLEPAQNEAINRALNEVYDSLRSSSTDQDSGAAAAIPKAKSGAPQTAFGDGERSARENRMAGGLIEGRSRFVFPIIAIAVALAIGMLLGYLVKAARRR